MEKINSPHTQCSHPSKDYGQPEAHLKIQFATRSQHPVSVTEINQLLLYREKISVLEPTRNIQNTQRVPNVKIFYV